MKELEGRVALVTGGAGGIGLGMALAFKGAGMRVAIADIDAPRLAATAAAHGLHPVQLDITRAESWAAAVAEVEASLGPIDLLCNNAGVMQGRFGDGTPIHLADMPETLFRTVVEINLTGSFLGVRAVVPGMIARGRGHIVNTSSMAGLIAPGGLGAYAASKYAVLGMTESLRAELAPQGIGVSVLCPGAVESELVATSAARHAATRGETVPLEASRPVSYHRMTAEAVGARVLQAVRENALYILTHPDYAPLFAERAAAITAGFGAPAEPGYSEPEMVLTRSRNPEYARAAHKET